MKVIVGCIVEENGKFLMVKEQKGRNAGKWNFPIGHLEETETIIEGAARETFEETGYLVTPIKMLPITEIKQRNEKYILIRFLAEIKEKINNKNLTLETKWMNKQEIFSLAEEEFRGYKSNRQIIKYLQEKELFALDIIR